MRLVEARRRAGLSAGALERAARVRDGLVDAIETRSLTPAPDEPARLAAALCTEVEAIDERIRRPRGAT